MDPVQAALLAGLLPGAIALAGLALGLLLSRRHAAARARQIGEGAGPGASEGRPASPARGAPARLAVSLAAGLAVALAFFLIQEQLKPGSTGLWPKVAINRAASLSVVCAIAGVIGGLAPRSRAAAPVAIGLAGALFAWGLGGPVSAGAGRLALWIGAAAAWGLLVGGVWHSAARRRLAEPGGAAVLVASALVPMGAAPVLFFGGGSILPQPAMSLVAVAGATVAAALLAGPGRIGPLAGGVIPLLTSGTLLLAVAMWTNYRPSLPALGLLMAAPLGLLPVWLVAPKRVAARWAVAIIPVVLLVAAAGIVAWQMAPSYDEYGY